MKTETPSVIELCKYYFSILSLFLKNSPLIFFYKLLILLRIYKTCLCLTTKNSLDYRTQRAPPENLVFSLHDKSNPRIESCQMRTLRKRKSLIPLMMIKKPQLENSIDCLFSYLLQFLKLKTRSIGRIMVIIIIIMEFPFTNFNNVSILEFFLF